VTDKRTHGESTASRAESKELEPEHQMKYALEHFKYLADQRMKTFNYYALLMAAAITGSIAAIDKCSWHVVVAMGCVHLVMAWVFFIIDIRNSKLVFCARRALRKFECDAALAPELQIIRCDHEEGGASMGGTRDLRESWGRHHWFRGFVDRSLSRRGGATFTMAFNTAFILQVFAGLAMIVAAYWLKGPGASPVH